MITVKRGERTQILYNDVQVAAFKANGWAVVETAAGVKQGEPKTSKTPKTPKTPRTPAAMPEQEPQREPEKEPGLEQEPQQKQEG